MKATAKRSPLQDKIVDIIEKDRQDLVDLCLYLASFPSYAGKERVAVEPAVNWMKEHGIHAYAQPITEESANAIGVLPGTGDGTSLIMDAHLDIGSPGPVGPATPEAKRMETGWVEGEIIYGYPIINCKAQVAAFMVAARALKKAGIRLKGDLTIAGVAFETGGPSVDDHQGINYPGEGFGSRWLIDRGIVPDYALIGETSGFGIVAAECGVAQLKVRVPGRSIYTPRLIRGKTWQENPNPFARATYIGQALEEWAVRYEKRSRVEFYGGEIVPKAQMVGMRGGRGSGQGGSYCDIYLDIRLAPGADPRAIRRELRDLTRSQGLECEVLLYQWSRGYIAQNADPLIDAVKEAHRSVFGGADPPAPPTPEVSMWRDLNAFNEVGIPSICYGAPRQHEPYTDAQDRAMKISDLVKATQVYALTAMNLCGVTQG